MVHLYGKFYLTADGNSYTVGIPSAVSDRRRASGRTAPVGVVHRDIKGTD